jgi:hypothetical protein
MSTYLGGNNIFNPITQAGDALISYQQGNTSDTGALVIAPMSTYSTGIRMTSGSNGSISINAIGGVSINDITYAKLSYIKNVTSDIQTQINSLSSTTTATANSLLTLNNGGSSNVVNPTFSQSLTIGTNCFIKASTVNSSDVSSPYSELWTNGSTGYYPTTANTSWLGIMQTDALYVNRPYIARDMIMKNCGASNNILFYGPDSDYATYGYVRSFGRISMNSSFDIVAYPNTPNGINLQANGSSSVIKLDSVSVNITANTINLTGSSPSITSTNPISIAGYLTSSLASNTYQTISGMTNYITSSSLTTTLSNYITSSSLTTTLSNYITSSSLTTTLSNYITSSSLTTTLSNYITSSYLASTLSSYVSTSLFDTTLSNYTPLTVLSANLNNYLTISAFNSSIAGYQTSITPSTNLSINNLNVGGYAVLPCIVRQNQALNFSVPNNSSTILTFPTAVNSIGNIPLTYSNDANATFKNTSGTTISVNVCTRILFPAGGTGYRNVYILHSNTTYGRVGEMTISNQDTTKNCFLTASANLILANNEYFQVYVYQTSGGSMSLANTASDRCSISIR